MKCCRHSRKKDVRSDLNGAPVCSDSHRVLGRKPAFGGLTPASSLIPLRKSSSLLFFLIKSDNIWRAREDRFNVANVTAGVILAILAICFMSSTFILSGIRGSLKRRYPKF